MPRAFPARHEIAGDRHMRDHVAVLLIADAGDPVVARREAPVAGHDALPASLGEVDAVGEGLLDQATGDAEPGAVAQQDAAARHTPNRHPVDRQPGAAAAPEAHGPVRRTALLRAAGDRDLPHRDVRTFEEQRAALGVAADEPGAALGAQRGARPDDEVVRIAEVARRQQHLAPAGGGDGVQRALKGRGVVAAGRADEGAELCHGRPVAQAEPSGRSVR